MVSNDTHGYIEFASSMTTHLFVKESTKITWKGRGYPVTKMILLGPLNILYSK